MGAPAATRARDAALLAVAACAVVALYLLGLDGALANSDEALYAEFIRAMHRSGDFFTLRYGDVAVLQRPAAPVSLYASVSAVVPGEQGMRLGPAFISALCAALAAWTVLQTTRRGESEARAGRADLAAALAALFLCAGSLTFFTYGRIVASDPPFVLATTLALWATLRSQQQPRYCIAAAAALGAAFAFKSLAAGIPAVLLFPWLLSAWLRHRKAGRAGGKVFALSVLAFVLLAAPFYVWGFAVHGGAFWEQHFAYNLGKRAAGQLAGIGLGGPLAYLEHLLVVDGPILFVVFVGSPLVAVFVAAKRRSTDLGIAATLAAGSLLLLSAVGTRLQHYLLVFIPPAAVCAALLMHHVVIALGARWRLTCWAGAAAAFLLFVGTLNHPPFDNNLRSAVETAVIGDKAREAVAEGAPVYSLNWYSPALGYYADRPWRALTWHPEMVRIMGSVDIFQGEGSVALVPPWPAGNFVVAGRKQDFADPRAPIVRRLLAEEGEYAVVEASAP